MGISIVKLQAISNLSDIWWVAKKMGLEFCLLDGTLLGAYRDKDFCEGDEDDIDIGIFDEDYDRTDEFVRELEKFGFKKYKEFIVNGKLEGFGIRKGANQNQIYSHSDKIKLVNDMEATPLYNYVGNHIDVIRINKHPKRDECYNVAREWRGEDIIHLAAVYPSSHLSHFDTLRFYGMDFNIPNNVEGFLTNQYGDWKTKVGRDTYDWYKSPNLDYDYDILGNI